MHVRERRAHRREHLHRIYLSSSLLLSNLELSDTKVYEPYIRARLGTAAHFCKVVVLKLRTVYILSTDDRVGHLHSIYQPDDQLTVYIRCTNRRERLPTEPPGGLRTIQQQSTYQDAMNFLRVWGRPLQS